MMCKVQFPKTGFVKTVDVYPAPTQERGEDDEAFAERKAAIEADADYSVRRVIRAKFRLMPRPTARAHAFRFAQVLTDDAARVKALEAEGKTAAGGMTAVGVEELEAAHKAVLRDCLVAVSGPVVGEGDDEVDLSNVADPERLIDLLEQCDLIGPVAMAGRAAQRPTARQLER